MGKISQSNRWKNVCWWMQTSIRYIKVILTHRWVNSHWLQTYQEAVCHDFLQSFQLHKSEKIVYFSLKLYFFVSMGFSNLSKLWKGLLFQKRVFKLGNIPRRGRPLWLSSEVSAPVSVPVMVSSLCIGKGKLVLTVLLGQLLLISLPVSLPVILSWPEPWPPVTIFRGRP